MAIPRIGQLLILAGLLFMAWGIAGWFLPDFGDAASPTFTTDAGYNIFYLVLGMLTVWSGVTWNPDIRHAWASVIGVVFLGLAILGFIVSGRAEPNAWVVHLENPADNVVHLVLGLLFVLFGVGARSDEVYAEPAGTTMNFR